MPVNVTNFRDEAIGLATSLTSNEKMKFSEALYTSLYQSSDFAQERIIRPGVRNGHTVPIFDNDEDYASFPAQTGCADNECTLDVRGSAYKYLIGNYNCKIGICLKDFDEDFLLFFNTWKTDNGNEGVNTALVQFLANIFKRKANSALWTKSFIAEENSNIPALQQSNGHLNLAEAGEGVKIQMAENAPGATPEQIALNDVNIAYNYFNQMYNEYVASDWFSDEVVIEVNKKLALNYLRWVEVNGNKTDGCCLDVEKIMNSQRRLDKLNFKGIPIKVRPEYDKMVASPRLLNGEKPHFALMVNKNNLIIGTEQRDKLSTFDIWYSQDANKIFMRGELNMGAALPTKDYILAY